MSDPDIFGEGLDPEDIKTPNKGIDAAYIASSNKTFLDKEISGWSGRRRAATFEIGFQGSGSVLDPIRVVYCCICSPAEITNIFRSPTMAIEKFLSWAEENKCMDPSMETWTEAFKIAEEIMEEVERSEFKGDDDDNNAPENQEAGNVTGHLD